MAHTVALGLFGLLITHSVTVTRSNICLSSMCEYHFVIRHARTMVYRPPDKSNGYSVSLDGDRLKTTESAFRKPPDDHLGRYVNATDVITADGYVRNIITINGQFPGPTISVAEGSQVVVRVTNKLQTDGVTIHWHGMHQRHNIWMDGAAYITQCPIQPDQSFTYRFIASPSGTHWYHSHFGNQRIDGLNGMLIVYNTVPELPHFAMSVTDWFHVEGATLEITNPYSREKGDKGAGESWHLHDSVKSVIIDGVETAGVTFQSALINGRGRWNKDPYPLSTFHVEPMKTYRFRTANTGGEFRFQIGIDRHVLRIVALDGAEVEPFPVDSYVMAPGETVDFEVTADQSVDHYWVRANTMKGTRKDGFLQEVTAILIYQGATVSGDPKSSPRPCDASKVCRILNCPFPDFPTEFHTKCFSIAEMRSVDKNVADKYGLKDNDVMELFLNAGYNWGSSINGRKFVKPTAPVFQKDSVMISCEEKCRNAKLGCVCTGKYVLPFNKTIQLVLSNLEDGSSSVAHHPMHLHGHNFAVLKVGFGSHNATTGKYEKHTNDVICEDSLCKQPRWNGGPPELNFDQPPVKDTILVPARGYVVVRMRSDNPGPWLYHCHALTHVFEGMSVLIEEAPERYLNPPQGFPVCNDFHWTSSEFRRHLRRSEELSSQGSLQRNADQDSGDSYSQNRTPKDQQNGQDRSKEERPDINKDGHTTSEQGDRGARGEQGDRSGYTVALTTANLIGIILGSIAIGAIIVLVSMVTFSCARKSDNSNVVTKF